MHRSCRDQRALLSGVDAGVDFLSYIEERREGAAGFRSSLGYLLGNFECMNRREIGFRGLGWIYVG